MTALPKVHVPHTHDEDGEDLLELAVERAAPQASSLSARDLARARAVVPGSHLRDSTFEGMNDKLNDALKASSAALGMRVRPCEHFDLDGSSGCV